MYWYTLSVNCEALLKVTNLYLRVKVFLCNKKDPKLLKIILMTKNITLGSSQPPPFPRVWRQRGGTQGRGASVCVWLLHEQPRAFGSLRQTRPCSDDPSLENVNKSGTEAVWCLAWKYFYPHICLCFTYTLNPEKKWVLLLIFALLGDVIACRGSSGYSHPRTCYYWKWLDYRFIHFTSQESQQRAVLCD